MRNRFPPILMVTAALAVFAPEVLAVAEFAKTPQEEAMCQQQVFQGRDISDRANWIHMHHFCDCVRFQHRALMTKNAGDVKYNLSVAIDGCNYVLKHTSPAFYMRGEIHFQKAKALRLSKRNAEAMSEYFEAIRSDPDLIAAYVELADLQARTGLKPEALKVVTEGLRHAPESKALQRRYTEFGGALPLPEPMLRKEAKAPPTSTQDQDPRAATVTASPVPNTSTALPDTATAPLAPSTATAKKNPSCRFCPD